MSLDRIKAVVLQELLITKHSLEIAIDLVFTSFVNLIIFGFITLYLSRSQNLAFYLLTGMILWEVVRINQYSVSVSSMWNIWSHNMSNMFVAPLSVAEYLAAHMLSGLIKTVFIMICLIVISSLVFHFNLFRMGWVNIVLDFINLTLFSWSLGVAVLGLIFRYGTRIQSLSWSISYVFQPLTAAFYPLSILPGWIQSIARLFPPTYVFEAARANLANPAVNWEYFFIAFLENIFYGFLAAYIFAYLFNRSKETGQFARNDD